MISLFLINWTQVNIFFISSQKWIPTTIFLWRNKKNINTLYFLVEEKNTKTNTFLRLCVCTWPIGKYCCNMVTTLLPEIEYFWLRDRRFESTLCVEPCALAWCTLSSILPSIVWRRFVMEKLEYFDSLKTKSISQFLLRLTSKDICV